MRDLKNIQKFWHDHAASDKALCTIIGKNGSGYRGLGAKKLILKTGETCGYLSGGCLEGDIIRTAMDRWDEMPFIESFSTMSDEDRLMGYQTGCAGIIDILFERLPNEVSDMHLYLPYGDRNDVGGIAVSLHEQNLGQRTITTERAAGDHTFIEPWIKPLNLYVLGCGGNANPIAELAPSLGWDVTFLDYRDGNIIDNNPDVISKIIPLSQFGENVRQGARTAIIVMTHNYEADLDIIGQLNGKQFGYIGFVGPKKRFDQLCEDSKNIHQIEIDPTWASHVHAPAGLHKARTPEDIAFSIIAQIQFGIMTS